MKNNLKKNKEYFIEQNKPKFDLTHLNAESLEFNNFKRDIMNKNDSFYIRFTKYIYIIYILSIIFLIVNDYFIFQKVINSTIKFLRENVYFHYSKIATACVYNSALNLKLVREGVIQNDDCPNNNCSLFYADSLQKCFIELRVQKYDLSSFFQYYLNIFQQKLHVELYILNRTNFDHYNLDIDLVLNILISEGLKIIANFTNYFDEDPRNNKNVEMINYYINNILLGSLNYFHSDFKGFYGKEKEAKCDIVSYNSPVRIIISLILFITSSVIIFFLILKKRNMEIFFLDKIINFSSTNFENYLKNLDELKNKIRRNDDKEEEEEKVMDVADIHDDNDLHENQENNGNNLDNEKKDLYLNKNYKESNKKEHYKIKQQKMQIMSDFFIKYNLLFKIKIIAFFFLFTSYFIISKILCENMKKHYKEFDSNLEHINQIYYESFKVFLAFKEQIDIFYRTKKKSYLYIPSDKEIYFPKIGNSLLNIVKSAKHSEESLETLQQLYNQDSCRLLIQNSTEYFYCQNIFSSLLTKGLEYIIIQMSEIISDVIEEINTSIEENNIEKLFLANSSFFNYDMFIGYYMLESFLMTQKIFETFRNDEKNAMYLKNNIFLILFLIILTILSICVLFFIYSFKKIENSFLNFIEIIPSKYITDDKSFYKFTFKLRKYYY
jgi:hypothetical protein